MAHETLQLRLTPWADGTWHWSVEQPSPADDTQKRDWMPIADGNEATHDLAKQVGTDRLKHVQATEEVYADTEL